MRLDQELIQAVNQGDVDWVAEVLAAGADPNVKTEAGDSAFLHALLYDKTEIAFALLDAGADPNTVDQYGRSALRFAIGRPDVVRRLVDAGAVVPQEAVQWAGRGKDAVSLEIVEQALSERRLGELAPSPRRGDAAPNASL